MSRLALSTVLALALPSLFSLGCSPPPLPAPGFEQELNRPAGCTDIVMYTRNRNDTLAVVFQSSGQVAAARSAGKTTTFNISLPQDGVILRLYQGERLTENYCSDYILPGSEPSIAADRTAASGTATLTLTPDLSSSGATGTLRLSNVLFTDPDSSIPAVSLGALELPNVSVGWLPG